MYIARTMLFHNGKEYRKGQEVPLNDQAAQALLDDHAVLLVGDTAAGAKTAVAKAAAHVAGIEVKLADSEKALADEKTVRAELEKKVKELETKLAAAAKPKGQ